MVALIEFVFAVIGALITAVIWLVIANAIVSWLIAFDVINMRNHTIRQIVTFLDAITRPLLRPFRRFIPPLGGVDITPVLLIIILGAAQQYLLPALGLWLISLVGG
ncbi:MAG TPA: YggT family protein [Caulobacteraceae bacterium]|nr:YggT family protein [Caulobacteraceae bacterium]